MSVCRTCGAVEKENWRTLRQCFQVQYLEWDDFKRAYPEAATRLLIHKYVQDKYHCYRRSGKAKQYVHRVYIELWKAYGRKAFSVIPAEKIEHFVDVFQTKLTVYTKAKQKPKKRVKH